MGFRKLFNDLWFRDKKKEPEGPGNIVIETPRMILREVDPEKDAARLWDIIQDPDFNHYCFNGTKESLDTFLEKCVTSRTPEPETGMRKFMMLSMELKDTGEMVGNVSLERYNFVKGYEYETNFFVDPNYQSNGYGFEAIVNISRYALEDLDLPGLNVTIRADNIPSLKVAKNMGYTEVGETTVNTPFDGPKSYVVLKLSREEFYEQRKHDKRPLLMPRPSNDNEGGAKRRKTMERGR